MTAVCSQNHSKVNHGRATIRLIIKDSWMPLPRKETCLLSQKFAIQAARTILRSLLPIHSSESNNARKATTTEIRMCHKYEMSIWWKCDHLKVRFDMLVADDNCGGCGMRQKTNETVLASKTDTVPCRECIEEEKWVVCVSRWLPRDDALARGWVPPEEEFKDHPRPRYSGY